MTNWKKNRCSHRTQTLTPCPSNLSTPETSSLRGSCKSISTIKTESGAASTIWGTVMPSITSSTTASDGVGTVVEDFYALKTITISRQDAFHQTLLELNLKTWWRCSTTYTSTEICLSSMRDSQPKPTWSWVSTMADINQFQLGGLLWSKTLLLSH